MRFFTPLFTVLLFGFVACPATAKQPGTPQLGTVSEVPDDRPLIGFTLPRMPADEMQSLHDASVLKDLEIVDEQRDEIEAIQLSYNERFQVLVRKMMSSGTDSATQEKLTKELLDFHRERTDALSSILLPHQLVRVKQVTIQNTIEYSGGLAAAVNQGELAKRLNISDEQKEQLKKIQTELQKEISKKTLECKEAARKRVLESFSAEQRRQLKEMTGEKFVRRQSDWQEMNEKRLKKR